MIQAFEKAVMLVYKNRKKDDTSYKNNLKKELKKIDVKIDKFIERIWKTRSEILIDNYEKQIEVLEREKLKISENLHKELKNVWTPLKRKMKIVRNSLDIWKNSDLENKKMLLKNIFPEWIPINKKKQVWTPTLSLIYQAFSIWKSSKMSMVEFIKNNLNNLF